MSGPPLEQRVTNKEFWTVFFTAATPAAVILLLASAIRKPVGVDLRDVTEDRTPDVVVTGDSWLLPESRTYFVGYKDGTYMLAEIDYFGRAVPYLVTPDGKWHEFADTVQSQNQR